MSDNLSHIIPGDGKWRVEAVSFPMAKADATIMMGVMVLFLACSTD